MTHTQAQILQHILDTTKNRDPYFHYSTIWEYLFWLKRFSYMDDHPLTPSDLYLTDREILACLLHQI